MTLKRPFWRFFDHCSRVFRRFASNLVETCTWHRRIVLCKIGRHDVTTSRRYCVKTFILAVVGPLWPCFSTDLLQIWYRRGYGIGASYHEKIYVMALVTLRRNDVISIDLKVGPSEPRGFCDWQIRE